MASQGTIKTSVLPVDARNIGTATATPAGDDILDDIDIHFDPTSQDAANLNLAAHQLHQSDVPVAFPTETVYGLGADATRSDAVRGIYKAKRRPVDNPLIVHFASLEQLRTLLRGPSAGSDASAQQANGSTMNGIDHHHEDPIPNIYRPLISKFWPGPLTIILPNPPNSPLAPEVTAGLSTFGARMPRHLLALALIKLANKPIAAPSANASTKPSPTAAEHVFYDLNGRIETIIDGGPCDVGVESTVVDGLSQPPLILRPGGISLEQLRACPGWEGTQIGYKDVSQTGEDRPKAPGMKYRHYAPKATVVLYEAGKTPPTFDELKKYVGPTGRVGLVTTQRWRVNDDMSSSQVVTQNQSNQPNGSNGISAAIKKSGFAGMLDALKTAPDARASLTTRKMEYEGSTIELLEIGLGRDIIDIARGIFSALRELDQENVDAILVEGIDEFDGDTAAAVMNRLRKAAEVNVVG